MLRLTQALVGYGAAVRASEQAILATIFMGNPVSLPWEALDQK